MRWFGMSPAFWNHSLQTLSGSWSWNTQKDDGLECRLTFSGSSNTVKNDGLECPPWKLECYMVRSVARILESISADPRWNAVKYDGLECRPQFGTLSADLSGSWDVVVKE